MKKSLKALLIILLSCPTLLAHTFTNVTGRTTTSLNGQWHYIIDPYENGFYNYRFEENPNGFGQNKKAENPGDLVEYDFDESPTMNVPGDWNSQVPELKYYEGAIWYKTSFDYDLDSKKRLFMHFGAANHVCYVYLNGTKLGSHEGGFTPFAFEISNELRSKDNHLVVMVENKRQKDRIPTVNTDWWNYGGITRDVQLVETSSSCLYQYSLLSDGQGKLTFEAFTDIKTSSTCKLSIPELGITKSIAFNNTDQIKTEIEAKPKSWSPDSPSLYEVIVEFESDKISDLIGFKTFEVKERKVMLNGENVFLKGICLHEEQPWESRRANTKEDAFKMLKEAKDLGCNYVRLAHYPHNEHMLRAADELGLMVWAEIPVYWTIEWKNPKTLANAKQQLEEMVLRDLNRASIIIWSVGNETPVKPERTVFMKSLIDHTHALDPSRPVSAALEVEWGDPIKLDDPLGEYLDILGCNEYVGWYGGKPEDCLTKEWESKWNKPLVITEFGGGAKYGNHGAQNQKWTEEYQADLYTNQLKMLEKIDFLVGMSPWILFDFRSPRRQLPGIQDFYNRKGLLSEQGEKKQAWNVMNQFYQSH